MEKESIQELIMKYNAGQIDPAELGQIEQLIEQGAIELDQLQELHTLEKQVTSMEVPPVSQALDDQFYTMLAKVKEEQEGFSWSQFFSWPQLLPKLAMASVMLIIGLVAGYFVRPSDANVQVEQLSEQVTDLKEMMMLSLLEKESATERLRAVSLTQEMDEASAKVTKALIQTLNQDENVNVRLAAMEALKPYVKNSNVRQELVKAISKQDSPLVQIALAELMAAIQEKSSVKELEKILKDDSTPKDVKEKIEESINVMI